MRLIQKSILLQLKWSGMSPLLMPNKLLLLVIQMLQQRCSCSCEAIESTSYLSVHDEAEALRKFTFAPIEDDTDVLKFTSHSTPFIVSKLVELAQCFLWHLHPKLQSKMKEPQNKTALVVIIYIVVLLAFQAIVQRTYRYPQIIKTLFTLRVMLRIPSRVRL